MIDIQLGWDEEEETYAYSIFVDVREVDFGWGATINHAEQKARRWLRERGIDDTQATVHGGVKFNRLRMRGDT